MTTPPRGTRTAIYLRISSDREGTTLGVERQRRDCRARADREGWSVVAEYTDNDVGASGKSGKPRPEYAQLIASAKRGDVDIILAYSTSRLTRRPLEYEELIKLSERGVVVRTIVSGDDDLSTADGQFVARVKAAQDAAESARISERVARKYRENANQGRYTGGHRPFGFEPDGVTIREPEAAEIRHATESILKGASLRSVCRDLNTRGVRTSLGGTWSPIGVRDMLQRPRNAGMVKYNPVERDDAGRKITNRSVEPYGAASWPAIVSDDKRRAVVAILGDPKRRTSPGNQPRWLGSSTYVCGVCGQRMRVSSTGGRAARYTCRGNTTGNGNHISRNAEKVDAVVNAAMVEWLVHFIGVNKLAGGQTTTTDPEWSALTTELSAIEERRKEIQQDYADGYFDRAQFREAMDRVNDREQGVRQKMTTGPTITSDIFPGVERPDDVEPRWTAMPVEDRRKLLARIMSVTILPTDVRGTAFDPASVALSAPNPHTLVRSPDVTNSRVTVLPDGRVFLSLEDDA